ncbi:hypothetical protein P7C70_g2715, partial [Phenoliferia sp. Uapishka_3]
MSTPATPPGTARSRPRRSAAGAIRSSVDVWAIQHPDEEGTAPTGNQLSPFPTVVNSPSSHGAFNSPTFRFPTPPKSNKSEQASSATSDRRPSGLSWQKSGKRPPRRRKDIEREALVHQAALGTVLIILVIAGVIYILAKMGPEKGGRRQSGHRASQVAVSETIGAFPHSFRHNLDPALRYVTSPQHGGLAHQTMSLYHLTYLAGILNRMPLIPPFYIPPSASSRQRHLIPASKVFNLEQFRINTNITATDWEDVRPSNGNTKLEQIGCWTASVPHGGLEDRAFRMEDYGLNPSFYTLRVDISSDSQGEKLSDFKSAYSFLANFDKDETAQETVLSQAIHPSSVSTPSHSPHRKPEHHLFCADHSLFHTADVSTHLDQYDHTAFRTHGTELHFTKELDDVGRDVVAFVLGHRGPFVAVHISQSATDCVKGDGEEMKCSYSLSKYIASVERIRVLVGAAAGRKTSREQRHQIRALSVVVSTNVRDIAFLGEIVNLGWSLLDHNDGDIRQKYGEYPADVVDGVVHSLATAFVGTLGSSESRLGALRVRSWRNGPVELIG